MGDRNGRWAMVIEKDGSISYSENEPNAGQVTVSAPCLFDTRPFKKDSLEIVIVILTLYLRSPAPTLSSLSCKAASCDISLALQSSPRALGGAISWCMIPRGWTRMGPIVWP